MSVLLSRKRKKMKDSIRIETGDENSLARGVEKVMAMIEELDGYLGRRAERKCVKCGDEEWMDPGETMCWRCKRIKARLMVANPNQTINYFWWNFKQHAWVALDQQPACGSEWGYQEGQRRGKRGRA